MGTRPSEEYDVIRPYVRELMAPQGQFSKTHVTLSELYHKHGEDLIQTLLDDYFDQYGANGQRDPSLKQDKDHAR